MQLCPKCGYAIGRAPSLGACYCGYEPRRKYTNIHEIESFQAQHMYLQGSSGARLIYNETVDPWFAYADRVYNSFQEWFDDYWNPKRNIRVFFKSNYSKDFDMIAFLNIVIKDGFLPEGSYLHS